MYPILGQFLGITLYTYGFVMMTALLFIYFIAVRRLGNNGVLTRDHLDDIGLIILFSIWIGGSLIFLFLFEKAEFSQLLELFRYGALQRVGTLSISASVALLTFLYCRWKGLPYFKFLDFLIPLAILGYGLQRTFGCFSAGCCYGHETTEWWAVRFPDTLGIGPTEGLPVHPTQLYLGITAFLTYGFLRWLEKKEPAPGTLTAAGIVGLFGTYFLIAFFRGDLDSLPTLLGYPTNQVFALLMTVTGLAALYQIHRSQISLYTADDHN